MQKSLKNPGFQDCWRRRGWTTVLEAFPSSRGGRVMMAGCPGFYCDLRDWRDPRAAEHQRGFIFGRPAGTDRLPPCQFLINYETIVTLFEGCIITKLERPFIALLFSHAKIRTSVLGANRYFDRSLWRSIVGIILLFCPFDRCK